MMLLASSVNQCTRKSGFFRMHHLEREGRQQLKVRTDPIGRVEMPARRHLAPVDVRQDLGAGQLGKLAAKLAAMGQQQRLIDPQLSRGADVTVTIDDHRCRFRSPR